jgi:hypothetical protein
LEQLRVAVAPCDCETLFMCGSGVGHAGSGESWRDSSRRIVRGQA